jgi:ABC-type uncharacterized transport system ATPase subunit
VALLDEPTSGLDPISRHDLYAVIDEMAANGTALLIASHALTELEARTDRIAIMAKGRLVADDSLGNLARAAALPTRIRLTAREGAADAVQAKLGGTRVNGRAVELHCTTEQKMAQLARVAGLGDAVRDVEMTPPSLEDLYRHYCGGRIPHPEAQPMAGFGHVADAAFRAGADLCWIVPHRGAGGGPADRCGRLDDHACGLSRAVPGADDRV